MTKPSEADDLGEGSDLEFPGQEVLEDGSVVGIDREQGWLTEGNSNGALRPEG